MVFVRSGCLRVYIMSEEGKDITLYRLHPGEMCMLAASCVLQSITFDVFIDAEEDSECYVINGCALTRVNDNNPDVKIFMLEMAVSRFSDVMWVMQQILFMSMDKRLAIFLYEESARINSDTINLTHEQIARYIGSAREVVSRMLKYFSNEGIVEVSRKGVKIIDKNRLKKLAF
jgi:CRP/FNR family transcriptional regulator